MAPRSLRLATLSVIALVAACGGSSDDNNLFGGTAAGQGGAAAGSGGTFAGPTGLGGQSSLGGNGAGGSPAGGASAGGSPTGGHGPGTGGDAAGGNAGTTAAGGNAGNGGEATGGIGGAPVGTGGAAGDAQGGNGGGGNPEGPGPGGGGAGGDAGAAGSDTGGSGGAVTGTVETMLSGLAIPSRIAEDDARVYVTVRGAVAVNTNSGSVVEIAKSNFTVTTLATAIDVPVAIALGPMGVFFASGYSGHVYKVQKDGTGLQDYGQTLSTVGVADMLFAGQPSALYAVDTQGSVKRWDVVSAPSVLAQLNGYGRMAISGDTLVVAAEVTQIVGSEVDTVSLAGGSKTIVSNLNGAVGVATSSGTAFAAEPEGGNVWRAPVDGSATATTFATGESFPWAVATDNKHVYWVDRGNDDIATCVGGSLVRAPLAGGTPETLAQINCPVALAVDGKYVYVVSTGTDGLSDGAVLRVAK